MHTHSSHPSWRSNPASSYALECGQALILTLIAGWARRSRSLLVMNAGSCGILETLWEAGFDITGQDSDPALLASARNSIGRRAELVLSAPDHLPFDDCAFDYAVAVAALDFWDNPESVLKEIARLTCTGAIILFPNRWSLFGLECFLSKKNSLCSHALSHLQSPYAISRLIRKNFEKSPITWASVLPGPTATWKRQFFLTALNTLSLPVPLGAIAGVRMDFGPAYTGTPMMLTVTEPAR